MDKGGFFFFLLMVTFSKRIESSGKTEGVRGVLSEKMFKVLWSDGSEKEGASVGLCGGEADRVPECESGGKSLDENKGLKGAAS